MCTSSLSEGHLFNCVGGGDIAKAKVKTIFSMQFFRSYELRLYVKIKLDVHIIRRIFLQVWRLLPRSGGQSAPSAVDDYAKTVKRVFYRGGNGA